MQVKASASAQGRLGGVTVPVLVPVETTRAGTGTISAQQQPSLPPPGCARAPTVKRCSEFLSELATAYVMLADPPNRDLRGERQVRGEYAPPI